MEETKEFAYVLLNIGIAMKINGYQKTTNLKVLKQCVNLC
jgi:hypothetical protein